MAAHHCRAGLSSPGNPPLVDGIMAENVSELVNAMRRKVGQTLAMDMEAALC
jgi:hypothetical protein